MQYKDPGAESAFSYIFLAYFPYFEKIEQTYEITLLCVCVPIVARQQLSKKTLIVARQQLGKNPSIVAR
jgi:hypothetical protein